MNNYKYTLESYTGKNSRYTCPNCNKEHRFTRYMDTETGIHLAPHVGRCNREVKCGYHYKPKQFFQDNPDLKTRPLPKAQNYMHYPHSGHAEPRFSISRNAGHSQRETLNQVQGDNKSKTTLLHTTDEMKATLNHYEHNYFIQYLIRKIGKPAVDQLLKRYHIGTHQHWAGSTVFWQVDSLGQVMAGKVMLYDHNTGKRVKQPHNHISWMHSVQKKQGFTLKQCFFGEHLLAHTRQPIAIAESEKAALVGSHYLPQFTWLATGGAGNISMLQGHSILSLRRVVLYPDCGMYERWKAIADGITGCIVDRSLLYYEQEPEGGYDIADYYLGKTG